MWYFGITTTKLIAPFPGAEKIRGEWAVQCQLAALGIESHAPEKITFERSGKKRIPEPTYSALYPGYIVADMDPEQFTEAMKCRGMPRTLMPISNRQFDRYFAGPLAEAEEMRKEAEALIKEGERSKDKAKRRREYMNKIAEYSTGEQILVKFGPFAGHIMRFTRMVESAGALYPEIEADAELFGMVTRVKLDPLDVRAAS